MKAGSAKGAQIHLLVNICHSFFTMTVFLFFQVGVGRCILLGLAQQWNAHPVGQSSSPLLPAVTFLFFDKIKHMIVQKFPVELLNKPAYVHKIEPLE